MNSPLPVKRVFPVVHYRDWEQAYSQAMLAAKCGASGVFLINHESFSDKDNNEKLFEVAASLKQSNREFKVGVNLLGEPFFAACVKAIESKVVDMLWTDTPEINSNKIGKNAILVKEFLESKRSCMEIFASVAFKYQAIEHDPSRAAQNVQKLGFIPTTSGSGTGCAPSTEKISTIRKDLLVNTRLAIASGITPNNISGFLANASDFLVATGISRDEYFFDEEKITFLIKRVISN